jgi:glutamate formiminotransferase/formiminotetrahydrofolate cyclodeaminase
MYTPWPVAIVSMSRISPRISNSIIHSCYYEISLDVTNQRLRGQIYFKGELVKHEPGRLWCGVCLLALPSKDELFRHASEAHGVDMGALMLLHDQDPDADPSGKSALRPGLFRHCRAIGWEVPQYGRAQISINLTDWKVTPPHLVLEKARELAAERGLVVTGSEVVGLVPLPALVAAGRHYLERQGRSTGVPLDDVLETAVQSMGLRDVAPFSIAEKVLGYPERPAGSLVARRVDALADEVSRDSPAPGGGSIAALAGAFGAALGAMVANLAIGKPGFEAAEARLRPAADQAQSAKDDLLAAVDADTDAFAGYLAAVRMPKGTPEEQVARRDAMQRGLREAVAVPLSTATRALEAIEIARLAAELGPKSSVSDAGVGALMGQAAVLGATLNVRINLGGIEDATFVADMRARCDDLEGRARAMCEETLATVRARM